MKINYLSNNTSQKNLLLISYSMTLSSMEISINNKEIILKIIDYLISINKCSNQFKSKIEEKFTCIKDQNINNTNINNYIEFFPSEKIPGLKISLMNYSKLSIEYNENKLPYLRPNFYHQIKEILNTLSLNEIEINKILNKSYFSIRYTPYNCRNKNYIQTSFVNYYQFKINEERNTYGNKYVDIPLIGILPLKFNHEFFLENINNDNYGNNNADIMIVNRLAQNVTNNCLKNNNENSIDVEYYLNQ
jgi:hypothetical protein